jgi:hypothetical protein
VYETAAWDATARPNEGREREMNEREKYVVILAALFF